MNGLLSLGKWVIGVWIAVVAVMAFVYAPTAQRPSFATDWEAEFRHRPTGPAGTVALVGNFNDWDASATPMTDPDGDGTYEATVLLRTGNHKYRFVVDGADVVDAAADSTTVTDDRGEVGIARVPFGEATAHVFPDAGGRTVFAFSPPGEGVRQVNLVGSLNDWNDDATPLTDPERDGIWEVAVDLEPGPLTYRFAVTERSMPWPSFRIVFFHVPAAWISVLAFTVSMIASIMLLRRYDRKRDDIAMASSELGFLFCALALISGMIWAKIDWGAYWNWDPRQASVMILLLIYGGYFTLRSSIPDAHRMSRLAAVYSIVAFPAMLLLVFVVPRIMFTLHPSPIIDTGQSGGTMDGQMKTVFFLNLAGFTGLYVWMLFLRTKLERVTRRVRAR